MKNPVAKNTWKYNKKKVHKDKTKYHRKGKTEQQDRKEQTDDSKR